MFLCFNDIHPEELRWPHCERPEPDGLRGLQLFMRVDTSAVKRFRAFLQSQYFLGLIMYQIYCVISWNWAILLVYGQEECQKIPVLTQIKQIVITEEK